MRNRPTPIYDGSSLRGGGSVFAVDAEPGARLTWLFVAMTLPLIVVAGRIVHLQAFVADSFAVESRHETESLEAIPARNGRILASDGTVLACDEERYRVLVHYRWLEEPPNDRWLRDEALSRLSRTERRDKQKVAAVAAEVLAERESLWRSLAELTEVGLPALTESRRRVQQRVERVFRSVEERLGQSNDSSSESPRDNDAARWPTSFPEVWQVVRHELTTMPMRERHDPLRIAEQSDDHVLIDDVPLDVVVEIETHPDQFPGVRTDVTTRRIYPHGRVAPHLVGYRGEIDADELQVRRERFPQGDPLDIQPRDSLGRSGIEQSYDHVLRGVRGQRRIVRDRHGAVIRTEIVRSPKPGRDVALNLSMDLQNRATALLDSIVEQQSAPPADDAEKVQVGNLPHVPGGCIVAIDVHSGAILAAATAPTFDVNDLLNGTAEQRLALFDDERRPLFARATQMTLPPGSVFKVVSAIALLQSGRIDPDRAIECVGYLDQPNKYRCYSYTHFGHGHYDTDLTKAIAQSCNVYFFKAARTIGPQPLCLWADQMGFGQPTGVDVPSEKAGHVPRPPAESPAKSKPAIELASHDRSADGTAFSVSPWDEDNDETNKSPHATRRQTWHSSDTLGLAIGQSRLVVTPLQIARLMAAVANDGWLVTPHVAREIVAVETATPESIEPTRRRIRGLSDGTLARVREGLAQVVAHPQGTGFKTVRLKDVRIAGKTGTAEVGDKKSDHAWFAGYVPAERPQVAFVVVLEQAGSGGKMAGPVAQKFVKAMLDQNLIRRD